MAGIWDFLSFAAPASTKAVDNLQDQRQFGIDLANFQKDPENYKFDPAVYNHPEDATRNLAPLIEAKRLAYFQKSADPILQENNSLLQTYREKAGMPYDGPDAQPGDTYPTLKEFAADPGYYMDFGQDPRNNPHVIAGNQKLTDKINSAAAFDSAQKGERLDPFVMGDLMQNEKLTQAFHQSGQAVKQLQDSQNDATKAANTASDREQVAKLNAFIANADKGTYGDGTPGSFIPALTKAVRDFQIANGLTSKAADDEAEKYIKSQYDLKKGQEFSRSKERLLTAGNATKKIVDVYDPHGDIIRTEELTNHPSAKELGLGGDKVKEPKLKYVWGYDILRNDGTRGPGMLTFNVSNPEHAKYFEAWTTNNLGYELSPESETVKDLQTGANVKSKKSPISKVQTPSGKTVDLKQFYN